MYSLWHYMRIRCPETILNIGIVCVFSFFTMLFSGGMVSWYMICANVLKLSNTIWALIVPSVMNSWYVVI